MSRSAVQKAHTRAQCEKLWHKTARRRRLLLGGPRETLAEWEARGGQVTRCEPITDDPAAAIARAAARSKREAAPKVVKASPRNTAKEKL